MNEVLAILVGGGPAPGINGVISSATIEARLKNIKVIGFYDGWKWLAQGIENYKELHIRDVSRIQDQGGSIIRISREGDLNNLENRKNVIQTLKKLKVSYLIVIGGDGTARATYILSKEMDDSIKIVHIPKTIDNDIPLPHGYSTFGFQTARHYGVDIVRKLMEDSVSTLRWYLVISMGRNTGHLSLAIGKASGATLTIIPEEFNFKETNIKLMADILETSILKRMAMGQQHGVAILAEGLKELLPHQEKEEMGAVEKGASGHLRFSELNLGSILQKELTKRLQARGIHLTIVSKRIGYELRCAPPIPFDIDYTRTLGYGAVKYLVKGQSGTMIYKDMDSISAIALEDLIDSETNKLRLRKVNIESEGYEVAREYMIRLKKRDLEEKSMSSKLFNVANTSKEEFIKQFGYMLNL